MYTLDSLKKKANQADELNKKLDNLSKKSYEKDERFWTLSVNKEGIGEALIRFLPEPAGEELPMVSLHSFSFKGPTGKYYIENSRTTIGPWEEADPVNEMNKFLWNTLGGKQNEDWVRKNSSIKYSFISNILVLEDPANPENNGKVFLFRYGKEIKELIDSKRNPQFATTPSVNIFDPFNGCALRLRAYNKATSGDGKVKYRTYKASEWMSQGPINEDQEKLVEICNGAHSLAELVDPKKAFKPYEVLAKQLNEVMGYNVKERINSHLLKGEEGAVAPESNLSLKEELDDEVPDLDTTPPFDINDDSPSGGAEDDVESYFASIKTG